MSPRLFGTLNSLERIFYLNTSSFLPRKWTISQSIYTRIRLFCGGGPWVVRRDLCPVAKCAFSPVADICYNVGTTKYCSRNAKKSKLLGKRSVGRNLHATKTSRGSHLVWQCLVEPRWKIHVNALRRRRGSVTYHSPPPSPLPSPPPSPPIFSTGCQDWHGNVFSNPTGQNGCTYRTPRASGDTVWDVSCPLGITRASPNHPDMCSRECSFGFGRQFSLTCVMTVCDTQTSGWYSAIPPMMPHVPSNIFESPMLYRADRTRAVAVPIP